MHESISFAIDFIRCAVTGGRKYYTWLGFLGFFILLMFYGAFRQLTEGMIVTNLNDQVSWGIYMSNVVFLVGVAAAAVTVVFPSYVYHHKQLKEVVVIGEMLAISAVTMVIFFVMSHMGRPDRLWHIIPVIGIFNWPNSMLAWDVLVLNGYLALNAIGGFYYMYKRYTGQEVNMTFYKPLVYISIVWALSIHTVTAFLVNTMPARPMWAHSIMPIKFIITAFAAGPSMIIVTFLIIRNNTKLKIKDEAINLLSQIVTWCLGIALFLTLSEFVTEVYPGTEHGYSLMYLMFGAEGLSRLVMWYWASIILMIAGFVILLNPRMRKDTKFYLPLACVLTFAGIWIDKGMGLVLPGFIPSPIGEYAEYMPSYIEIINTVGNWAAGLFLFTLLTKGAIGVLLGEVRHSQAWGSALPEDRVKEVAND
ncbi:MAG TPA: NrfD/PsrC family molybdoenzyme membrane anchor subunit [Thermodesulfobacteriota bacterium]|nr:NrfD/PsrC family molybdoenzyme membrane anchor subunit [Thermodesulfobacteriota bacterium]